MSVLEMIVFFCVPQVRRNATQLDNNSIEQRKNPSIKKLAQIIRDIKKKLHCFCTKK